MEEVHDIHPHADVAWGTSFRGRLDVSIESYVEDGEDDVLVIYLAFDLAFDLVFVVNDDGVVLLLRSADTARAVGRPLEALQPG